jgi:hypothetical protein
MKLCEPAMVYAVLALIGILFGLMGNVGGRSIVAKGIYAILWTLLLNFLCEKGYKTISWILVILPFVMIFGVVAAVLDMGRPSNQPQPVNQSPPPNQPNQPYQPPVYHTILHR